MNRVQLVQVLLIIAIIVLGCQMIYSFVDFIERVVSDWPESGNGRFKFEFRYTTLLPGILASSYAIGLVLLLSFAHKISLFIVRKVGIDDSLNLGLSDKSVVYATMLFLLFSSLIRNVPVVFLQSIIMIQESFEVRDSDIAWHPQIDLYDLLISLFQIIFCMVLLIKIKMVVNFFHSKINPIDSHIITVTGKEQ